MKINKTMGVVALGLGLAIVAQAQPDAGYTPIYITGSTAFRSQIFQALKNELGLTVQNGGTSSQNSFTFEGNIADPHSLGMTKQGTPVEVFCDFSGSAEGVETILNNVANNYLSSTGVTFVNDGADFAFSDVAQNSTPYPNPPNVALPEIQLAADASQEPFTGCAVVTFTFAVNKQGAAAGISNITDFNVRDLYRAGTLDECFFTGVAPGTTSVYAVGRYNLSGTRITAELDDYDPTSATLKQYALGTLPSTTPGLNNGDSSAPTGNAWVPVLNGGYFTGGNVGVALANSSSVTGLSPAIGYIGWSDAQGKFGSSGAVPIKWDGQNPGSLGAWNITGLENGDYTFFSYERLYEKPSDKGTAFDNYGQDLVLGLQYEIVNASPQTADIERNMNVYRPSDGADVVSY